MSLYLSNMGTQSGKLYKKMHEYSYYLDEYSQLLMSNQYLSKTHINFDVYYFTHETSLGELISVIIR